MTTDSIALRLINQSAEVNNTSILIFAKNAATTFDEIDVAWQVIENLGAGWVHPFQYDLNVQVGAEDSYGNLSPPQDSADGQRWTVVQDASGHQLEQTGPATSPLEIQILNGLVQGAIAARIYRSGKLFAIKTGVAPDQTAVFSFKPTIYIGVVSQVQEGQFIDSAIISNINTQLNLTGIASADIVMSGGGPGKDARSFVFTLQNVRQM